MSLTFVSKGDIFASKSQALANAVNCVGVMGGGLALLFARRFPLMNQDYKAYCAAKKLRPGGIHVYLLDDNRYIFNVATKDDFTRDSQYEWIVDGLKNIAIEANRHGITSVAVPALGCGLGNLSWDRVKKIIEEIAPEHWQNLDVEVYEPL
jgi:O-acetyl-ADP-ribose deacetylase (regulator of RNase III)